MFSCYQNVGFKLLKIAPTFETRGFQRLQPISQLASLQSKNVTQVCIFTSRFPKGSFNNYVDKKRGGAGGP